MLGQAKIRKSQSHINSQVERFYVYVFISSIFNYFASICSSTKMLVQSMCNLPGDKKLARVNAQIHFLKAMVWLPSSCLSLFIYLVWPALCHEEHTNWGCPFLLLWPLKGVDKAVTYEAYTLRVEKQPHCEHCCMTNVTKASAVIASSTIVYFSTLAYHVYKRFNKKRYFRDKTSPGYLTGVTYESLF